MENVFDIVELHLLILQNLSCRELFTLQRVSRSWEDRCKQVCNDAQLQYRIFSEAPKRWQVTSISVFASPEYNVRLGTLSLPLMIAQKNGTTMCERLAWKLVSPGDCSWRTPKLVVPVANPLLGAIMRRLNLYMFHDRHIEDDACKTFRRCFVWRSMYPCVPPPARLRLRIQSRPEQELEITANRGVRLGDIAAASIFFQGRNFIEPTVATSSMLLNGRTYIEQEGCRVCYRMCGGGVLRRPRVQPFDPVLWSFAHKEIAGSDAWQELDHGEGAFERWFYAPPVEEDIYTSSDEDGDESEIEQYEDLQAHAAGAASIEEDHRNIWLQEQVERHRNHITQLPTLWSAINSMPASPDSTPGLTIGGQVDSDSFDSDSLDSDSAE